MWPWENNPLNPDAAPVLDGWGWDNYWNCAEWIQWHRAMKATYGQQTANERLTLAWESQDWTAHNYSWCKYDSSFYDYIKANFPDETANVFAAIWHSGTNVVDTVANATDTVKKLAPLLIIFLLILAAMVLYRKSATV